MSSYPAPRNHQQKGAVLVTTAILLVGILLLGVSAIILSRSEFKLSGNLQYQVAALNEAEAAVTAAETWLAAGANFGSANFTTYSTGTNPHLYPIGYLDGSTASKDPLRMTWDDTNSVTAGSSQRRYLIEKIANNKQLMGESKPTKNVNVYRIIARGESARGSVKFVQSIFSVRCYDAEQKLCSQY